jgi:hypothetical protein
VYHTQFTGRVVEKDLGEVFTVEELQIRIVLGLEKRVEV